MNDQRSQDELSELLRRIDPLAEDPQLSSTERVAMRRAVMAAVPDRRLDHRPSWAPALSVTALLVIALVAARWPRPGDRMTPLSSSVTSLTQTVPGASSDPGHDTSGDELDRREIQFETPGGTLVVWVLDPKFPS